MEELLNDIEKAIRLNCKGGDSCFWTLHICDNAMPSASELKQPQSKNMNTGNVDESIDMLKECISISAGVGKKYIVVALRSSANDPSRTILPFINPTRRKRAGIGSQNNSMGMGSNGFFGLYLNQLQENTKLQLEIQDMRSRARMRAMRRSLETKDLPPTGIDRIMAIVENPAYSGIIQSAIGKILGINVAEIGNTEMVGESVMDESQQAEVLKYSVETLNEAVGNEIDVFNFLKIVADFVKKNPEQVKSIYYSMKAN